MFQLLHELYAEKCIRHNYIGVLTVPGDGAHVGASMMRRTTSFTIFAAGFVFCLQAVPARAQSPRAFVSGTGNDASATCSRAAPCRTFAVAITRTNTFGEITVLDPAGYGTVTITKSISIATR
jgi:hypothetical protein